jgi:phage/plasmid primase-like uncharacterized protein
MGTQGDNMDTVAKRVSKTITISINNLPELYYLAAIKGNLENVREMVAQHYPEATLIMMVQDQKQEASNDGKN